MKRLLNWRCGKALISLCLLSVIIGVLDTSALWGLLRGADPRWLLAALGVTLCQVVLSAWRWQFTAGRLGMALPLNHAVREYYVATFLNQVLPGGIMGDASRAWRHGRLAGAPGPALRAVILERASGQVAMLVIAVPALLVSTVSGLGLWQWSNAGPMLQGAAVILGLAALIALLLLLGPERFRQGLGTDVHQALLTSAALPIQLLSSLLVVASYIGVFLMMSLALGLKTPLLILAPLAIVLLLAMAIPVSIAGWGMRESTAAVLWPLAGLGATQGVAVSVAYGLLILISSLPGALFLLMPHIRLTRNR